MELSTTLTSNITILYLLANDKDKDSEEDDPAFVFSSCRHLCLGRPNEVIGGMLQTPSYSFNAPG